jgi:iron complex outermembrane receptor protein
MIGSGTRLSSSVQPRQLSGGECNTSVALAAMIIICVSVASPVHAQDTAAPLSVDTSDNITEIVVTARNRAERAQDVPIPISVLTGADLQRDRAFTVSDLTQRAPGLTATTPNARRTGVSIRGIGKTSGNDNMEPAVGVIVDDVFLGHAGMTYQDFTDLDQVEILRGPQGTLLGKNTTLGAIKYTSRAPSFSPQTSIEAEGGANLQAFKAHASHSDALIDDVLAYRVSAFRDQQEGDLENVGGGHWHERNRYGGRLQLLAKPADHLNVKVNLDAAVTDENSNTKPFMVDPLTLDDGSLRTTTYTTRLARNYFGGYTPIIGSWEKLDLDMAQPLVTKNYGASTIVTWDTGPLQVSSISAARWFHFDAKNDQEQTRFPISRSGTLVDTRQLSQEFRVNGAITPAIDYQTGVYLFTIKTDTTSRSTYGRDAGAFFATNAQYATLATPQGIPLLQRSLDGVYVATNQKPVSDSAALFGQVNWHATDHATLTLGLRDTYEWKKSVTSRTASYLDGSPLIPTGNATADAIRLGQTSTNFGPIEGEKIKDHSLAWLINPSYEFSRDLLLFASVSSGEKSGAVAFDANGKPANVSPEKALNYEIGIKSAWWDNFLVVNANVYYTKVSDYQNVTSVADPTSSTGFSSLLGNIPGLRAEGVELESIWHLTKSLSVNLGGSYNDAIYTDWATATCPRSTPASTPVCDNTGKQIVGAPRWTGLAGFDYNFDLVTDYSFHLFGSYVYRTKHNLEQLLSPYGEQKAYSLTDLGAGVGHEIAGINYDLSVIARNAFDTKYTTSVNDFSNNAPVGYDGIGARRYVGLVLGARF